MLSLEKRKSITREIKVRGLYYLGPRIRKELANHHWEFINSFDTIQYPTYTAVDELLEFFEVTANNWAESVEESNYRSCKMESLTLLLNEDEWTKLSKEQVAQKAVSMIQSALQMLERNGMKASVDFINGSYDGEINSTVLRQPVAEEWGVNFPL